MSEMIERVSELSESVIEWVKCTNDVSKRVTKWVEEWKMSKMNDRNQWESEMIESVSESVIEWVKYVNDESERVTKWVEE